LFRFTAACVCWLRSGSTPLSGHACAFSSMVTAPAGPRERADAREAGPRPPEHNSVVAELCVLVDAWTGNIRLTPIPLPYAITGPNQTPVPPAVLRSRKRGARDSLPPENRQSR
jgi:hypothetical protein